MNHAVLDKLSQLDAYEWALLGAFILVYTSRLCYVLFFTARVFVKKRRAAVANEIAAQPLSVLLTVRNEEENLRRVLPQLLAINSVNYEVVVVDDYSLDNTYSVLGSYKTKYPKLRISALNEETRFSEKMAQNIALKAAKNEWVLWCPVQVANVGNDWLSGFSFNTSVRKRTLLLGYTGLAVKPGFYNRLCRLEMFMQQIKSAGFIRNGIPFVYFEDNVAFKRQHYFDLGGYGSDTKEVYANLELVINRFIRKDQTAVLFSEQTRLTKNQEVTRDDYHNLLRRSYKIESHLPAWKRFVLNAEAFTALIYVPLALAVLFCLSSLWLVVAVLAGGKFLVDLIIMKIAQKRLNERKIFIPSLIYGLIMPYFKMIYRWHFKQQSRNRKWKTKV